jgi:hypothetical protein
MANDFKLFPIARIAMDNGDLMQTISAKLEIKRNNKHIHTMRRIGAGKFHGSYEAIATISGVLPEDGPERDYLAMLVGGRIKKLRFKIPGETISVTGSVDERTIESSLEDAIKNDIIFSGHPSTG